MNKETILTRAKAQIFIGIDPGVNTGLAVWQKKEQRFISILTINSIISSMRTVLDIIGQYPGLVFVRVEDARLRKWFGKDAQQKKQGAGSVKRDCKIWEDELTKAGVPFELVHPIKNSTKWDAERFKQITGYSQRTSKHGRDAALLVYKF